MGENACIIYNTQRIHVWALGKNLKSITKDQTSTINIISMKMGRNYEQAIQ